MFSVSVSTLPYVEVLKKKYLMGSLLTPQELISWSRKQNTPCKVQFSCLVMSNSLQPHGLQHTRLPCPSPTPRSCSNSCPSSVWCHPKISSTVVHFSSCLQSFTAAGSFQTSQFLASGGQSIGVSALTSASNEYSGLIPLGWIGWISLQNKGF